MDKRYSQIILRPIVTEKSAQMTQLGQYTFEVTKDANKVEIKQAMEQLIKEEQAADKEQSSNFLRTA